MQQKPPSPQHAAGIEPASYDDGCTPVPAIVAGPMMEIACGDHNRCAPPVDHITTDDHTTTPHNTPPSHAQARQSSCVAHHHQLKSLIVENSKLRDALESVTRDATTDLIGIVPGGGDSSTVQVLRLQRVTNSECVTASGVKRALACTVEQDSGPNPQQNRPNAPPVSSSVEAQAVLTVLMSRYNMLMKQHSALKATVRRARDAILSRDVCGGKSRSIVADIYNIDELKVSKMKKHSAFRLRSLPV